MAARIQISISSPWVTFEQLTTALDLVLACPHRWHPQLLDCFFDEVSIDGIMLSHELFERWATSRRLCALTGVDQAHSNIKLQVIIGDLEHSTTLHQPEGVPTLWVDLNTGEIIPIDERHSSLEVSVVSLGTKTPNAESLLRTA